MRSFRLRLILALIAGITVVSVASTYFEVLSRKHVLRHELEVRTGWLGTSLQPFVEHGLTDGVTPEIAALAAELRTHQEALGLAIYDARGNLVASDGPAEIIRALQAGPVKAAIKHGINSAIFSHTGDLQWLEEAIPLHVNGHAAGAIVKKKN